MALYSNLNKILKLYLHTSVKLENYNLLQQLVLVLHSWNGISKLALSCLKINSWEFSLKSALVFLLLWEEVSIKLWALFLLVFTL
jgi:hypothetical protein